MGCLCNTKCLLFIIAIGNKDHFIICIDGTRTAHANGKGNSRFLSTMGRGAMLNRSKKLKLVMNSSTENEVISSR